MTDLFDRLKTALADRYAIRCEMGSGGMATACLAQALEHHPTAPLQALQPGLPAVLIVNPFRKLET